MVQPGWYYDGKLHALRPLPPSSTAAPVASEPAPVTRPPVVASVPPAAMSIQERQLRQKRDLYLRQRGQLPAAEPAARPSAQIIWAGHPAASEPLKILYVCSNHPGYGGAATESYEAIRALRARGHVVAGLFFTNCADRVDPDHLGGIRAAPPAQARDRWLYEGTWHVVVCKFAWTINQASAVLPAALPCLYITSGVTGGRSGRPDATDVAAFRAARQVLVHSTLDLAIYNALPKDLFARILPEVVRTSALAAVRPAAVRPLAQRTWDVCFAASDWRRPDKGGGLMQQTCDALRKQMRIVVCGDHGPRWVNGPQVAGVEVAGLVPHTRMLELMADSRVVAIPSAYDSSPNVYIEAALAGCNVVVTDRVGNCEGHPAGLRTSSPQDFVAAVVWARALPEQLVYRHETPQGAADRLEFWVRKVAEGSDAAT